MAQGWCRQSVFNLRPCGWRMELLQWMTCIHSAIQDKRGRDTRRNQSRSGELKAPSEWIATTTATATPRRYSNTKSQKRTRMLHKIRRLFIHLQHIKPSTSPTLILGSPCMLHVIHSVQAPDELWPGLCISLRERQINLQWNEWRSVWKSVNLVSACKWKDHKFVIISNCESVTVVSQFGKIEIMH